MDQQFDITAMDMEELLGAKAVLKKRFPELIEGYLEDAQIYLQGIEDGLASDDMEKIAKSAHPLKSASAGLGVAGVSRIAKAMEETAKNGGAKTEIEPLVAPLKDALAYAAPKLRAMLDDAA